MEEYDKKRFKAFELVVEKTMSIVEDELNMDIGTTIEKEVATEETLFGEKVRFGVHGESEFFSVSIIEENDLTEISLNEKRVKVKNSRLDEKMAQELADMILG